MLNVTHIYLKLLLQKLFPIKISKHPVCLFLKIYHIIAVQLIAHSLKSILEVFMFSLIVSVTYIRILYV